MPEKPRTRWDDFKVGDQVEDTWYRDCGRGTVGHKTKRHLTINFPGTWGTVLYDRPHATRFLEIMKRKRAGRKAA